MLIERHGGEAVRFFLLTTQYRNPINFEVVFDGDDARPRRCASPASRRPSAGSSTAT